MLEILSRSIARAGGIEVPDGVRIFSPAQPPRPARRRVRGLFTAMAAQYRQWRDRRATYQTLAGLSDHHLKDIGLHRGMLERAADDLTHIRFANDNRQGGTVSANDNAIRREAGAGCA